MPGIACCSQVACASCRLQHTSRRISKSTAVCTQQHHRSRTIGFPPATTTKTHNTAPTYATAAPVTAMAMRAKARIQHCCAAVRSSKLGRKREVWCMFSVCEPRGSRIPLHHTCAGLQYAVDGGI